VNTFQNAHIFHRHGNVKWLRFITIEGDNFRFLNPRKMSSINFFSYPSNENNIQPPRATPRANETAPDFDPLSFDFVARGNEMKEARACLVDQILDQVPPVGLVTV